MRPPPGRAGKEAQRSARPREDVDGPGAEEPGQGQGSAEAERWWGRGGGGPGPVWNIPAGRERGGGKS